MEVETTKTERRLASIRTVSEIRPIPGADRIVCAMVDGWPVVTQKDGISIGDRVAYFEIDSYLPIRPEFEFLRKSSYRNSEHLGEGFRLKTMRLRGQLSQGLIMPLAELGIVWDDEIKEYTREDVDGAGSVVVTPENMTELLNVRKYEKPLTFEQTSMAKGNFPDFLRKTDQERVQNCYGSMRQSYEDEPYEMTIKLDGSSMTVYHRDGEVGVCSRNLDLLEDGGSTFWKVARESGLVDRLRSLGNVAVQGELMGPGIQGNREGLTRHEFHVFDVWDIDEKCFFDPQERWEFYLKNLDGLECIDHVWILSPLTYPFQMTLEELLETAEGRSIRVPTREGIVFKPHRREIQSFKVIANSYLEAEED